MTTDDPRPPAARESTHKQMLKTLLKEKPSGLCDPECEGRCRVCPAEYVERLLAHIATLSDQLEAACEVGAAALRQPTAREALEALKVEIGPAILFQPPGSDSPRDAYVPYVLFTDVLKAIDKRLAALPPTEG